jgi:ribosomal protein S9
MFKFSSSAAGRRKCSILRKIVCPKCGAIMDISGKNLSSLAPKKPTILDKDKRLFSAGELQMLEIRARARGGSPFQIRCAVCLPARSNVVGVWKGRWF